MPSTAAPPPPISADEVLLAGIRVSIKCSIRADEIEFRDTDGKLLGRIVGMYADGTPAALIRAQVMERVTEQLRNFVMVGT